MNLFRYRNQAGLDDTNDDPQYSLQQQLNFTMHDNASY